MSAVPSTLARELFVRHAMKDGRSVARLRAVDHGDFFIVEAVVQPVHGVETIHPGPYRFASAGEATAFVTQAVEALIYLGCDVLAN